MTKRNLLWAVGWLVACCAIYVTPLLYMASGQLIIVNDSAATPADTTAPTVVDADVNGDGDELTVQFDDNMSGTDGGWSLDSSGGDSALTLTSLSGSMATFSIDTRVINSGETVDVDYDSGTGDFTDDASNALATVTSYAVDNNSTQGGTADATESFEGTAPSGWTEFSEFGGNTGQTVTTNAVTPPSGGGTYVCQEIWDGNGSPNKNYGDWLRYTFSPALGNDDVLLFEYHVRMDPNFDYVGGSATIKHWLLRHTDGNVQYINSHLAQKLAITRTTGLNYQTHFSNTNGNNYTLPTDGSWTKVTVEIGYAEDGQTEDGYYKIWVNDTLRFDYSGFYNLHSGQTVTAIDLESYYNNASSDANNKRQTDLIEITVNP